MGLREEQGTDDKCAKSGHDKVYDATHREAPLVGRSAR
jgi:hypothetical protein